MRSACSWTWVVAFVIFAIGCGGGEKEQKPATTGKTTAPKAAATSGAYQVMAVTNGGSITGTVTYAGEAPAPAKLPVTKDVQVCGATEHYDESLVVSESGGIKDVVVSLKNIHSGKGLETLGTEFVLNQEGCRYSPHVSIVPVNTPLKILNPDGILHNIHSYSEKNPSFNKSQPKFKNEMETSFEHAELVKIKCDVHGWMSANLVVVDHPYYAKTDDNGTYTLTEVPPGNYTVEFWQEKLGTQTAQVTVTAGTEVTLDYTYPAATASSD